MSIDLNTRQSELRQRLFQLLPAIMRVHDKGPGGEAGPLEELIAVIAAEVAVVEENLDQLYDDQFIETCAEWVVPYIGDLLGVRGLQDTSDGTLSQRAFVANTIGYRRRKGTAAVLEQLAFDVTNWRANAVEYFERLATTQYLNHTRPGNESFSSVRSALDLGMVDTPFDALARTVDVRRIASGRGKHNIPNAGIFLWRLGSYRLTRSAAVPVGDGQRYLVNPAGSNLQLATQPTPEPSIDHLATPLDVPMPIGRLQLAAALDDYYGPGRSIEIWIDGDNAVPDGTDPAEVITVCNLSDHDGTWAHIPDATMPDAIHLDPVLGRIAVGSAHQGKPIQVTFSYRFAASMGGGEYGRPFTIDPDQGLTEITVGNQTVPAGSTAPQFASLVPALAAIGQANDTVVTIVDSGRYDEGQLAINAGANQRIDLRAADGCRPAFAGDLEIVAAAGSRITLDGLLVTGGRIRVTGEPATVRISHCTLVPGRALSMDGRAIFPGEPSLVLDLAGTPGTEVTIDHSITGPLRLPADGCTLTVTGSIVDSPQRPALARRRPALVSGDLTAFPAVGGGPLAITVTIGDEDPATVPFTPVPNDLPATAANLQAAIQAARPTAAFSGSQVIAAKSRLILLPGGIDSIRVRDAGSDTTATLFRLVRDEARQVTALAGGPIPANLEPERLDQPLAVTIGEIGPHQVTLNPAPDTRDDARNDLQAALDAIQDGPGFGQAIVAIANDGLLIVPGTAEVAVMVSAVPDASDTLDDLVLASTTPAIAGGSLGNQPGPATTIERSTVFGAVNVRQIDLASDSIFTDPLVAGRRQVGCVRFCHLPDGSRTPRRYGCVPEPGADAIHVRPSFTSYRYGDPGYCQLGPGCPDAITRGASDESEMGVFHDLHQPQREDALRIQLYEYLRFSLEAGIFHAS